MTLILASASPRRRELLARAGVPFEVAPADVDERQLPGETPEAHVARVAGDKATAAAARRPDAWVLAADTIVVLEGDVLGKAQDAAEATRMVARLAGRTHRVMTATCLLPPAGHAGPARRFTVTTEVEMRPLAPAEVAAYVQSGEWQGKAGAYAAQGIAAAFVSAVRGSFTNVVGLPLSEVLVELARGGAPAGDLARGVPA